MFENLLDPFKAEIEKQKIQGEKMLNVLNEMLCVMVDIKKELEACRASNKKGK